MEPEVFFRFSSKFVSSTFEAYMIRDDINHLKLIKGEYAGIDFPVEFKHENGNKLRDVLDTGFVSLFLISDRFKGVLEENKITGWKVYPIRLLDKKSNEIFGYQGFTINGRCKSTNFEKSEIIEKRLVPEGPLCKYYKGIFIEGWDGSDFFSPYEETGIFVTKNAAEKLKESKLTNIRLYALNDYEINITNVK